MTIDTIQPRSRRALLTAAVGGLAAATAASLTRVMPAEAANGDAIVVGGTHSGTLQTTLTRTTGGANLVCEANGGIAVAGQSGAGTGVRGVGSTGVSGIGSSGAGVHASGSGLALHLAGGRVRVEQVSGVATIKKGTKSTTVTPGVDINAKTFVLLTPMADIGSRALWFTKKPVADQIVIRMSSARNAATRIAWLALERG